ncbi:MAG: SDR family NAD(P)-dependent oxidoreductase, partial [Nitrososphaerota archaeon]
MAAYAELAGKVALVTGGGAGIGGAASAALAAQGVRVAIVDKDDEVASQLAARINADGGQALAIPADVTRRVEV